jgi:hypothetical protein
MDAIIKFFNCGRNVDQLPNNIRIYFEKLKILISYSYLDISVIKETVSNLYTHIITVTNNQEVAANEIYIIFRKEMKRFFRELKRSLKKEVNYISHYISSQ